jgi:uncharacterized protein YbaR (Trm112 family)
MAQADLVSDPVLRAPCCGGELIWREVDGMMAPHCDPCRKRYPVSAGIPVLITAAAQSMETTETAP